jgi:hypothetical protein
VKARLPEYVAQHDRRRGAELGFLGREGPPELKRAAEHGEVVLRYELHRHRGRTASGDDEFGLRARFGLERPSRFGQGEQPVQCPVAVAISQILRVAEPPLAAAAGVTPSDTDETVRILHGQRPQRDHVDHAEQRRVDADAERQCQHRGDRERRGFRQRTNRVSNILAHLFAPEAPPLVACALRDLRDPAELPLCGEPRLLG